jgi:hypothetical protein
MFYKLTYVNSIDAYSQFLCANERIYSNRFFVQTRGLDRQTE